ncbi:DUF3275 family protein [Klebsiella aerogenes]|uniref:DUF3275 family protein n=1 Tax=Klebsiella aerogenes TaxID=548 RepID=A0AAP9U6I2_KLEAE|nr:DUF3275 family protein [Klebsiella aerogenes]QMR41509.1 DUF3275 family protein [Klebsiella aerogenes]
MNPSTQSPVIVTGKLVIKTINGRNGEFNVGLLETAIGSFSIKDRELEQYTAGVYQGEFIIGRIFMHSWSYGANSGTEIRARLDEMHIETNDALTPCDAQKLSPPVNDPLDEERRAEVPGASVATPDPVSEKASVEAKPASGPKAASDKAQRPQFSVPSPVEQDADDKALFGELWPLGEVVKLDATAPRQTLRQQKARLSQLGYDFNAQEQQFEKAAEPVLH